MSGSSPTCNDLLKTMYNFNHLYNLYINSKTDYTKAQLLSAHADLTNTIDCYNNTAALQGINDADYETIINTYKNMLDMREDLDMKMQEIYRINNSISQINKYQLDATAFASILWTVLATSVVLVIFMKTK